MPNPSEIEREFSELTAELTEAKAKIAELESRLATEREVKLTYLNEANTLRERIGRAFCPVKQQTA